jgi:hypothetical protein
MKTITSLNQIIEAAKTETLYVRWSRGPEMDKKQGRSLDQVSGSYHNGLSAQNIRGENPELLAQMLPEYRFLKRKDRKIFCWIFAAVRNGSDSDGCPTIDAETIIPLGKVSDELIEKCAAFGKARHEMNTKYAHNAWKPEHFERNEKIKAEVSRTWSALQ